MTKYLLASDFIAPLYGDVFFWVGRHPRHAPGGAARERPTIGGRRAATRGSTLVVVPERRQNH